jgi:anti-sigma regulatory factor (Ser/Thr protein kinase)
MRVYAQLEREIRSPSAGELGLSALRSELSAARQYTGEVAAAFGFDADGCYKFVYAVNEAVTNAIRHGAPDVQGLIHLGFVADAQRLTFAVRDYGTFALPVLDAATRPEHGRGLAFMASLVDEVRLRTRPGRTIVHLAKARV